MTNYVEEIEDEPIMFRTAEVALGLLIQENMKFSTNTPKMPKHMRGGQLDKGLVERYKQGCCLYT